MQHGDLNSFGVWGGMFPATYLGNVVMSVIPRDCKIVRKSDALPELVNLKLVEANYKGDPQMAAADGCKECTDAGKSPKPLCHWKKYEPREPNECLQLDFWGPIRYRNESSKYVLVAVDRFSRWPSAMICRKNKSNKVPKFLQQ